MRSLSRRYVTATDDVPILIMSAFDDQPGLRLTLGQVRRLWDLSESQAQEVLAYLVGQGLLRRSADRQYCLAYCQCA